MEEKRICFSISQLKIMTAKHVLSEAGIPAFSVNKMDSSHPHIFDGAIELYVDKSHAEEAKKILIEEEIL